MMYIHIFSEFFNFFSKFAPGLQHPTALPTSVPVPVPPHSICVTTLAFPFLMDRDSSFGRQVNTDHICEPVAKRGCSGLPAASSARAGTAREMSRPIDHAR
jgi:hypothetical protein